jgi:hypothetical protein
METAKVDIRKLQFLNDRINQTIDALNQVRLSVHGLSHSGVNPIQQGFPNQQSFQQGFGNQLGQAPMASPQFGYPQGLPQGFVPGLSHTGVPFAGAPGLPYGLGQTGAMGGAFAQPFQAPFQQGIGQYAGQSPAWGGGLVGGGLSHTGGEGLESYNRPTWSDPLLAARLQQTFPYAQYAVPPVVTLY